MIEVKDLKKQFGNLAVLKGISETIERSEKVVIIGPSGSGKSTFLRCLNLLEQPTSGSIRFKGLEITDKKVDIDAVRQKMGMVFQHFNLFPHLTVLENIMLAPVTLKLMTKEQAREQAFTLLKRIGLEDKAGVYPSQISGGQKQRIAIVRSLAMKPEVMLFDEPTSALDVVTQAALLDFIHELHCEYGFTGLFVTHDLAVVQKMTTQVLVMEHGEIVEDLPSTALKEASHPFTRRLIAAQLPHDCT